MFAGADNRRERQTAMSSLVGSIKLALDGSEQILVQVRRPCVERPIVRYGFLPGRTEKRVWSLRMSAFPLPCAPHREENFTT